MTAYQVRKHWKHPRPLAAIRGLAALAVVLLALATLPLAAPAAAQAGPNAPSPAGSGMSVIAQGVGEMPADPVAWRVVIDTAELPGEAAFEERALGYAVATNDALLLTDAGTGAQTRLAAGEAAFVPEGTEQRRESLGKGPTAHDRIGLVPPADATFSNGDDLVFAGDEFAAPTGRRDLDIVRGALGTNQSTVLADTGSPTLLLVLFGELDVAVGGQAQGPLATGEVAAFTGDLTVAATTDPGAIFVAAVIGPEVPAPEEPVVPVEPVASVEPESELEAVPEHGEVRAFVRGCPAGAPPAGATYADFDATCRDPLAGTIVHLVRGDTDLAQATIVDIAAPTQSLAVWRDVAPGSLTLAQDTPAGYGALAVFCRSSGASGPPQPVQNPGFELAPGETRSCHFFNRPSEDIEPPADATGAIFLQLFACPPGITADDLPQSQDACAGGQGATELYLNGPGLNGPLTLADATPTQNAVGWTGLSLGEYSLGFAPPGTALIASATDADALGAPVSNTATSYPVVLTAANLDVLLQVYQLQFEHPADPPAEAAAGGPTEVPADVPAEPPSEPVDSDGDGLLDVDEINRYGSDPASADTDGDRLSDFAEVESGTDPSAPDLDPDGDGLDIVAEGSLGTNPYDPDSDDDGTGDAADAAPKDPSTL